ncbi:hypothetical protein TRFO_17293 [Tritrichomonas foetus]|uniref:Uncharacterized protein n=1 Tax=Tritrichomonas foetus TaxID=1144522 RepID=A0A1J4KSW3_9EUKA|nr:hypothetical protein TRFO_17293 [Tritrichomonas foetus]|eukprot:OHT12750.1 hypothetical protein TRFO_17293 [Tritrichomonas foetus]
MSNITSITIHNSCKKIAQLNRVIEYLTSFLEETIFQIAAIRTNVDADFQTIFKNHEDKVTEILSTISGQEKDVTETIKNMYSKRITDENDKLKKKRDKVTTFIRNEEGAIINEVKSLLSTVFLISQNMQNQIEILNRTSPLTDLQARIKDLEKNKKIEFRNFDKENKTKIQKFQQDSEKHMKEMISHFEKVKNDIKLSYEMDNPGIPDKKALLSDFLKKREALKEVMNNAKKDLNKEKTIATQNFTGFKGRLHKMINQLKEYESNSKKEIEKRKKENQEIFNNFTKQIKDEKMNLTNSKQVHQNELINLENEHKMIRSKVKQTLAQTEQNTKNRIMCHDKEIEEEQNRLLNELDQIKSQNSKEKEEMNQKISKCEQNLINKKEEFFEIQKSTENSKINNTKNYENELSKLKECFENEKNEIINKFKEIHTQMLENLNNQESFVNETEKAQIQLTTLQNELQTLISKFAEELPKFDPTSFENNQSQENPKDIESKLNRVYEGKLKELETHSTHSKNEYESIENKYQEELDRKYKNEMSNVSKSFSDEDFKAKIHEYEDIYKKVTQELNSIKDIDIPFKSDNVNELNETELLHQKEILNEKVTNERMELILKYQKEYETESENLPKEFDQSSYQIDSTSFDRIKESFDKKLSQLTEEIQKKEKELQKLEETKTTQFEIPEDEKVQKLKLRFTSYQQKSEEKIKNEQNRTEKLLNALRSQIQIAETKYISSIKMEKSQQDLDHQTFRDNFHAKSNYRKSMKGTFEERSKSLQEQFENDRIRMLNEHDITVQKLTDSIMMAKCQANVPDMDESIKQQYNNQFLKEKEKYDTAMETFISKRDFKVSQSDQQIALMKNRCDKAMESFSARPMRIEEKSVIDRLTLTLDEKTEKLKSIGKEFLDYREGLAIRDREFNQRFVRLPQVSIESRNQKRRSTTGFARKKPLPPLPTPNSIV